MNRNNKWYCRFKNGKLLTLFYILLLLLMIGNSVASGQTGNVDDPVLNSASPGGEIHVASGQTGNVDVSCYHCHSKQVNEFKNSVHFNKTTCIDCHGGDIKINGSIVSIDVMQTNFTAKPDVPGVCSKCHEKSTRVYEQSIHFQKLKAGKQGASCTDCHGIHNILSINNPNSSMFHLNVAATCAKCHENQTKMQALYYGIKTDRFDTFKRSYHYKSYASGGRLLATCSDCHEHHNIRSPADPKSSVNSANLPSTCGKAGCHVEAKSDIIYGGKVHEGQSVTLFSINVKKIVTYFYIIMILFELSFTIGLIFLGITSNLKIIRRH